MASFAITTGYRRIKRASRACERCHARKVRCDATVTGFPCTNCRLDDSTCQAFTGGRERRKQLSRMRARATAIKETMNARSFRQTTSPWPRGRTDRDPVQVPCLWYDFIPAFGGGKCDLDRLPLLEEAGALDLPGKPELDILLRHYFLYVHPFCPLVDEAVFWRAYKQTREGDTRIPLLLLRAMIFCGSCFVPAALAKRCGYDSLLGFRDDLYNRTKALYESGLETDSLTISRAALLLTFYCSDFDVHTNSEWLRISINEARTVRARIIKAKELTSDIERTEFKRLWWCCLIRDRSLALGMRRPLEITTTDAFPDLLTSDEMSDEIFGSVVYTYEVKSALFELLTSLCQFITAVTELATVAFPPTQDMAFCVMDPRKQLEKLETAKSALLLWELDWIGYMEGKNATLHPSISLFSSFLSIYYQSARVALCNRMCVILSQVDDDKARFLGLVRLCRSELITAVASIAAHLRQLLVTDAVDKLPLAVAAYTTTPYILLSINSQTDTKRGQEVLVLFTAINRSLGLRYQLTRVSNLASRALWLSRLLKESPMARQVPSSGLDHSNFFTLPLQQYTRLLQYIDESMSIPRDSAQETEVLYAAAAASPQVQTSLYRTSEPSPEPAPVWIEAMENFYFGPGGSLLTLPSCSAVEVGTDNGPSNVDKEDGDDIFEAHLELPWTIETVSSR
ncbi:fungal-specific transcription factor domain-containing protein [Aspergillus heterothallicus]